MFICFAKDHTKHNWHYLWFIPLGCTVYVYLVGCRDLFAVDGECHQAGGQVYQTADLQVNVAAARGVSSIGHIAAPHHVAVTPLHTVIEV